MFFLNAHTHQSSSNESVIDVINQYPHEFEDGIKNYSIGIHPWYIENNRLDQDLQFIKTKLNDENCLALGECGLDKCIEVSFDLQEQVFVQQLVLAEQFKKPVIIHCVAAFQEVIAIKNKMKITVPLIIHGFSKNQQIAEQLLKNGFYLSFGKKIVQNRDLANVFEGVPNDRFFLETDTWNDTIQSVYVQAAMIKKISMQNLQGVINENFKNIFKRINE